MHHLSEKVIPAGLFDALWSYCFTIDIVEKLIANGEVVTT